ncbi:hypothetical protein [Streptomyces mirabilis]|uniref:hypothetical protein n=1 Tax=Streptomyces mirabilis TaxID=68239 RepID=UPI00331FCF46
MEHGGSEAPRQVVPDGSWEITQPITLMTRRLTRRETRPAERRDITHGYVMSEAA